MSSSIVSNTGAARTVAFALLGTFVFAQQPPPSEALPPVDLPPGTVQGKIAAVSVYHGTALVTRHVDVPAKSAGPLEIVVTGLPTATESDSVFADRANGLEVRSVACRSRPPDDAEVTRGKVADLERELKEQRRKIAVARNEIALRRIRQGYLRGLENFVAPAAAQEMTHGVLQADELEKVTQMHFREYETASQEIMRLDTAIHDDEERLGRLEAERQKLAAGPPVTWDAVVFVERKADGPASFDLNYQVTDCTWSPVYNIRGDSAKNEVEIEFNALIRQVSGEDWTDAQMILSTASPTVSACNPRLTPLYVSLAQHDSRGQPDVSSYNKALAGRSLAVRGQLRGTSIDQTANANFDANDSAASVQLIELSERLGELRRRDAAHVEEDMSTQYRLTAPVSVISRREGQTVPVLRHTCATVFRHVAAPVLTSAVFREGELINSSGRDLLGGRVNVYLDGEFTGRTDLPTIARGRPILLGFGVDGQLRARRSILDREEKVQGGNRQVAVTTEVVVDNYRNRPASVRVRERVPWLEEVASLRLAIGATSHALSEDADYQRFEKPKGILLWDLSVPPGSGAGATTLRFEYSLEFDKNLVLQDISSEHKGRLKREYVEQQVNATKFEPAIPKEKK
ncbi:MAG: mucoidy inhibitor MuiA family protein [Verrucomicrobiales bacterium]